MATERARVRAAKNEDVLPAFRVEHEEMSPDFYPDFFFKQALSIFGKGFLVARVGDRVAGYLIVGRYAEDGSSAEIYSLVVSEKHRRKGIGRLLMQAALSWANNNEIAYVRLTVSPQNESAVALYKSTGFKVLKRIPDYYGPGQDRFVMQHARGAG